MRRLYQLLSPPVERPAWFRAAVVFASVGLALVLRLALEPWIGNEAPFVTLFPAVMFCAWAGGARAGIMATLACGVFAAHIMLSPAGREFDDGGARMILLLLFLVEGLMISALCGLVHHVTLRWRQTRSAASVEFEKIADHSPSFVWSARADGTTEFANRRWRDFTGVDDNFPAADRLAKVHPDDVARVRTALSGMRSSGRPCELEYRLRRTDGEYRWILEHAAPRIDDDGRVAGSIGSGTDITSAHQEREELLFFDGLNRALALSLDLEKTAEAVGRALVPEVADWCCIQMIDTDDGALHVVRILQLDPAKAAEAERAARAHDTPGAVITPAVARALCEGEVRLVEAVDEAFLQDLAASAAHLDYLRSLALVSYLGVPLRVTGRVVGVLSFATAESRRILGRDHIRLAQKIGGIAAFSLENARLYRNMRRTLAAEEKARQDRERSESALERQRTLLKTIIDAVPAMVAYIDTGERFVLHNRQYEEWLGLSFDDIDGKTVRQLLGEVRYPEAQPHLQAALAGNNVRYEKTIRAPHRDRDTLVTYRPDMGPDGVVAGVVIHAYDITESRQLAIAVARSEKRYRTLVNASATIVWAADASGRVLEANGWEAFTGRLLQGDTGALWMELIHPDDRDLLRQQWLKISRDGGRWDCTYRLLAADGRYHHVHSRGAPLVNARGQIEEWIGTVTDIQQRVEAEESLRRKEVELKLIVDTVPALVSYVDDQGRYLLANRAHQKWFGRDPEHLRGMTVSSLLGETTYAHFEGPIARALAGEEVSFEQIVRNLEGEPRWLVVTHTPHRAADGAVLGFFGLAIDITSQKQIERKLADLLERYRFLADAMPQNVWTTNAAGEQDYVNRRWVEYTGLDFEAGGNNRWMEIIHPDDADATARAWQAAVAAGTRYEAEHRLRDRHGNYHWFLSLALARRDQTGRIVQWVGTATNIDAQRLAYAELAEARAALRLHADNLENEVRLRTARLEEVNAELEAFTYSASHDLRGPLHHIRGFTESVLADEAGKLSAESETNLRLICSSARRMDALIVDLLAYSRLSRNEIALVPASLDLAVSDVLADHRAAIENQQAVVCVQGPLPAVMADGVGLQQVLANLVGNALKFVAPGGRPRVVIRAENRDAAVRLWIEDDGIGIEPRYHEDIFALFRRLHGAKTYPGTGVGLSLVRKGMARMGGTCGVESQPGHGSRFWLDFQPVPPGTPTTIG